MTTPVGTDLDVSFDVEDIPDPNLNLDFIRDMDKAMKAKVAGIRVADDDAGADRRSVPVYFLRPTTEAREQTYPYITIQLLRFTPARYREQRSSDLPILYTPKGYEEPVGTQTLHTDEAPIPYDFTWQVTTLARFIEHDHAIQTALMQNHRLPPRGAYLDVNGKRHYMEVLDGPLNGDAMQAMPGGQAKRLFRKIWTVRATAEWFQRSIVTADVPTEVVMDYRTLNDDAAAPQ
jgi:hypothetical protein